MDGDICSVGAQYNDSQVCYIGGPVEPRTPTAALVVPG